MRHKLVNLVPRPLLALGLALCLLGIAHAVTGNIDATNKWAYGTNVGWINVAPADGGVEVFDDHLEGYAWAENIGWIRLGTYSGGGSHTYANTAADNYGVNHDGAGNLSGYAWSTNAGWINFDPTDGSVTIDTATGEFDGYAWGENVGWIHVQNASPAYLVQTTWRPSSGDCTASESGPWTTVFASCPAGAKHVIPDGIAVTLDDNVNLDGDLEIQGSGSLDATTNRKRLTLTGGDGQTLTGDFTFYMLTLNKDNKTDTVTISGSLDVSRKLRVRKGKLISASDYEDIEIEADGELVLTGDITVSGHFTNTGTLTTDGNGITFDGGVEQYLLLNVVTTFDDLTVSSGTTLVETNSSDNGVIDGTLTNNGTIRKAQTVDFDDEYYYFGLAGLYPSSGAYGMEIYVEELAVSDPLTGIQVDRVDSDHANAPSGEGTGIYWSITPTGSGFTATVALPYTGTLSSPLACRWTGTAWDCGYTEHYGDPDWYVAREGVTAFSDWAVFDSSPPKLVAHLPLTNALDITTTTTVSATFDQNMNATSVTSRTFTVRGLQGGLVTGTHEVINNNTILVTPNNAFHAGEVVMLHATSQIESSLGAALEEPHAWQFTVDAQHGNGDGTSWATESVTNTLGGARRVYAADMDGDGDLDLLAAAYSGGITWWDNVDQSGSGTGDASDWDVHRVDTGFAGAYSVYAGDIDGDGDLDILGAAYSDNAITWWENTADDASVWTEHVVDSSFGGARYVSAADIDGDGDLDILGCAYSDDDLTWFENTTGNGSAWTEHMVNGSFDGTQSVHAADMDGDGDLDLLSAANQADDVAWFENTAGNGSAWTEHVVDGDFDGPPSVYAADVDGDGDLDILGAAVTADDIAWWENTAGDASAWTEHTVDSDVNGAFSVYAADVDGDGDVDILGASYSDDYVAWWENVAGDGSAWTEHNVDSDVNNVNGAVSVYAADVDNDGDVDILCGASVANAVTIWLNEPPPEPTSYPTGFDATADTSEQINTSWTDATGGQEPHGYLVLCNTSGIFSDPVDGIAQADDTACADGSGIKNVAHGSGGSYAWTGLNASTQYYYKVYPYTNSGADIDYKTDGTPPTDNATTTSTTAVKLATFTASIEQQSIVLEWQTANELETLGFHVWRASGLDMPRERLTQEMMVAQSPGSVMGAAYAFRDETALPGVTYAYWLEAVDVNGESAFHGPRYATIASLQRLRPARERLIAVRVLLQGR